MSDFTTKHLEQLKGYRVMGVVRLADDDLYSLLMQKGEDVLLVDILQDPISKAPGWLDIYSENIS